MRQKKCFFYYDCRSLSYYPPFVRIQRISRIVARGFLGMLIESILPFLIETIPDKL